MTVPPSPCHIAWTVTWGGGVAEADRANSPVVALIHTAVVDSLMVQVTDLLVTFQGEAELNM